MKLKTFSITLFLLSLFIVYTFAGFQVMFITSGFLMLGLGSLLLLNAKYQLSRVVSKLYGAEVNRSGWLLIILGLLQLMLQLF